MLKKKKKKPNHGVGVIAGRLTYGPSANHSFPLT